jgi:hypothetical protein
MAYGAINVEQMTTQSGYTLGAGNASSFKNRIINGAMVIDQRNAGASVSTSAGTVAFTLDRWAYYAIQASKFTVQQNAGGVTPPVGFTNYLGCTSTSSYAVAVGDIFEVRQPIEGYNIADLGWGTANAKPITLSFWAYSSLTGTFGGALTGNAGTSYPFSYSIPVANTWTQISISIAGPTIGTWQTTSSTGVLVRFSIGTGTIYSGTAGSWSSSVYASSTGAVSVVGTNGATFYVTGVQFETGTVATSFDYRSYTTEFSLCQRYFTKFLADDNNFGYGGYAVGVAGSTNRGSFYMVLPVRLRTYPTIAKGGNNRILYSSAGAVNSTDAGVFGNQQFSYNNGYFTVDALAGTPFTTGLPCQFSGNNDSTAYLSFDAEL